MPLTEELLADEKMVFEAKKHWISPVRDSVVPALLIVGAAFVGWLSPDGDGIFGFVGSVLDVIKVIMFVVGVVWIVYNVIAWRTAAFAVTNYRVMRDEGLAHRRSSTTLLTSLSDVKSVVPFMGARLGYGDIEILTQSGSAGADRFRSITSPVEFRAAILEQKMSGGTRTGSGAGAAAPAGAAPAPQTASLSADSAAALASLADLHDRGAITDAEYDAKKTEILARM